MTTINFFTNFISSFSRSIFIFTKFDLFINVKTICSFQSFRVLPYVILLDWRYRSFFLKISNNFLVLEASLTIFNVFVYKFFSYFSKSASKLLVLSEPFYIFIQVLDNKIIYINNLLF